MKKENVKKLKEELAKLTEFKDKKHQELSEKLYDVIAKKNINQKEVFYMLSKIEWQGKEALGVIRINELMQQALATKEDILRLTSTEMNALLYLLLRVKSNSKHDANVYSNHIFPIVHALEGLVAEAKNQYDKELKETYGKIKELEEKIQELEIEDGAKEDTEVTTEKKPKKL